MTHDNDNIDIDFELAPPDKLYAHNRRQLSAMLDGELSPDQARFMLRRLQHDGELAACWERWQVCGDLLRGHGHALLPADFSTRVAAAIDSPAAGTRIPAATGTRTPRPHRLLRWGGGALAASVALVALFMARQLPDAQAPTLVEAASPARSAPALVQDAAPRALADAGADALPPAPVPAPDSAPGNGAALLAAAVPAVVAVADVPRRGGERNSTRSQTQRAALRRSQATAEAPLRAVAAAAPPVRPGSPTSVPQAASPGLADNAVPGLASLPAVAVDGDALFGPLPAATTRPWPRAVLPGLSGAQPFAAGYGLPRADAFAPFQPRFERQADPRPQERSAPSRPEPRPGAEDVLPPAAGSAASR